MSRRAVFMEPEFGETQELEDSNDDNPLDEEPDDDSDEEDDVLGAAAAPAPPVAGKSRGRGLGRKKRGSKKPEPVNQFKADDDAGVKYWTDGLNSVLRGLEQCAKGYFPGVLGSEHKSERKENLKKFHDVSVELVGTRLKLEQAPEVVQRVFEDLDLERVAAEEEDDEAFCAMLDQFEEASEAELKKMSDRIDNDDEVSKDDEYNACLEVLNLYQKKKGKKYESEEKHDVLDPGTSSVYSEGLEALTEYVPTHDPVTRKVIVNPVVNRKCGHVYDSESIQAFLVEVGGIVKKCPYAGCKQSVSVRDLVVDEGMCKKVKERVVEDGLM